MPLALPSGIYCSFPCWDIKTKKTKNKNRSARLVILLAGFRKSNSRRFSATVRTSATLRQASFSCCVSTTGQKKNSESWTEAHVASAALSIKCFAGSKLEERLGSQNRPKDSYWWSAFASEMLVNTCIIKKDIQRKKDIRGRNKLGFLRKPDTLGIQVLNPSGRLYVVKYHYKNRYFSRIYTMLGTGNKPALPENTRVTGSSPEC